MPAPRAVLNDIDNNRMDHEKAHVHIDLSGHLKDKSRIVNVGDPVMQTLTELCTISGIELEDVIDAFVEPVETVTEVQCELPSMQPDTSVLASEVEKNAPEAIVHQLETTEPFHVSEEALQLLEVEEAENAKVLHKEVEPVVHVEKPLQKVQEKRRGRKKKDDVQS